MAADVFNYWNLLSNQLDLVLAHYAGEQPSISRHREK